MNRKARRAGRNIHQAAEPGEAASTHLSRGNGHLAHGRHEQAIDCYVRAIELQPDQMDAHNNLCAVLLAQGQFDAVARHFEQILAIKPDHVEGYNVLALAFLGAGNASRALDTVRRALKIREMPESKSLFVSSLRHLQSVAASADMEDLLVRAISEPWGRPADLVRTCLSLIKTDGDIAGCIERAAAAWPRRLPADRLFENGGLAAASRNPLVRCLLENATLDDIAVERYLTSVRLALLQMAGAASLADALDPDVLAFYCALARQCFINEYVFAHSDQEFLQACTLRDSLAAALRSKTPVPVLWPVAISAYMPLGSLPDCENLLDRNWPGCVEALLAQQVREPAEEHRLRHTFERLTSITDDVSVRVRGQYEENPYPRWVKAAPVGRLTTIDARLRGQFPFARFRNLERSSGVDVLVAGCGTGRQLVEVAQRIMGARVLAIDLSCTSLSYAKRQTDALGLADIEYAQADILQLGACGRTFDVIDCGGVLHHLGVPEDGWRVLLSLLRRKGVMRVALYSELARQHIVAARAFVAERGYGCTADDIRRFRQDVLALPDEHPVKRVTQGPDFFSVSQCRDLVFHVQEHRFTLPQIKAFLASNDLEFLGFEIGSAVLSRYGARCPADRARTDLEHWHAFEQENPRTFGGMYQFWVQKRA